MGLQAATTAMAADETCTSRYGCEKTRDACNITDWLFNMLRRHIQKTHVVGF